LIDPEKGVVYEGLVVESKPAVWGRYWFPDGSYQEGPAVTDRRRQHHKEQEQRELMDGEGFIAVIRDGSRYYGRFDNGKPSGPGIFRYPDGSVHRCNECLPFMYYTKSVGANTSVIRGYIIDQQFHKI
jgi:hypothetical protein